MNRTHTTASTSTAPDAPATHPRVPRLSWGWFAFVSLVVLALSVMAPLANTPQTTKEVWDDNWLIGTFGFGMGVFSLVLVLTAYRSGRRWAWATFWFYPVFFALHILLFGTWIPDAAFLVLSVAALALSARATVAQPAARELV